MSDVKDPFDQVKTARDNFEKAQEELQRGALRYVDGLSNLQNREKMNKIMKDFVEAAVKLVTIEQKYGRRPKVA